MAILLSKINVLIVNNFEISFADGEGDVDDDDDDDDVIMIPSHTLKLRQ